jgi:hypothetical protein
MIIRICPGFVVVVEEALNHADPIDDEDPKPHPYAACRRDGYAGIGEMVMLGCSGDRWSRSRR